MIITIAYTIKSLIMSLIYLAHSFDLANFTRCFNIYVATQELSWRLHW